MISWTTPKTDMQKRRDRWIVALGAVPLVVALLASSGCRMLTGPNAFKAIFLLLPCYWSIVALLFGHWMTPLSRKVRCCCVVLVAISVGAAIVAALVFPGRIILTLQQVRDYPCISTHYIAVYPQRGGY